MIPCDPIGFLFSFIFIQILPKRAMFLIQAFLLSIFSGLVAYLNIYQMNSYILIVFLSMAFVHMCFTITTVKIYMVQVTNNTILGLVYIFRSLEAIIVGVLIPLILKSIGMTYFFIAIACLNTMFFIFLYVCIRETKGLTEKQQKELYNWGKYY